MMRKGNILVIVCTVVLFLIIAVFAAAMEHGRNGPDELSSATSPTPHDLYVRRYSTATLSDQEADFALSDATRLLQAVDGPDDMSCNVETNRGRGVDTFNVGNGVITSQIEYEAINNLEGQVKVVNALLWCGTPGSGILGCAPKPGASFLVVRHGPPYEGILWAHEYLHNRGQPHRNGENFVMNPYITLTARRINKKECNGLSRTPIVSASQSVVASNEPAVLDVRRFIMRLYVHGIPYDEAAQFDEGDVPTLLELLGDDGNKPFYANILGVLGVIGGDISAETLIEYVEQAKDRELDPDIYRAALTALLSLGYVVNRDGSPNVIEFLRTQAEEIYKSEQQFERAVEDQRPQGLRLEASVMGRSAILGLALGGRPESGSALQSLIQFQPQTLPEMNREELQSFLGTALETHKLVEQEGLSEFYKRR